MNPKNHFKNGSIYIWVETFAIVKARQPVASAFVSITDHHETTVIIAQTQLEKVDVIEVEEGWKIFTLDIVFQMDVVGITAAISSALAKEDISIMPIAAFSRDHFLLKETHLDKARNVFKKLGLKITSPQN